MFWPVSVQISPLDPGPWARELEVAARLAREAAAVIRRHYEAPSLSVSRKADGSPVTAADLEADALIARGLGEAFPGDAIRSEESSTGGPAGSTSRVWIVDPLDGTRDLLERSGDFAVHIALAVSGEPVVAAVALPALGRLYLAVRGSGAICRSGSESRPLRLDRSRPLAEYRTGITRTASSRALDCFLDRTGLRARAVARGASVKQMLLAEGTLDLCITLHDLEHEWDSCAPSLIVEEAGGLVTDVDGRPLRYNQADPRHRRGVVMSAGPHHDAILAAAQRCLASR